MQPLTENEPLYNLLVLVDKEITDEKTIVKLFSVEDKNLPIQILKQIARGISAGLIPKLTTLATIATDIGKLGGKINLCFILAHGNLLGTIGINSRYNIVEFYNAVLQASDTQMKFAMISQIKEFVMTVCHAKAKLQTANMQSDMPNSLQEAFQAALIFNAKQFQTTDQYQAPIIHSFEGMIANDQNAARPIVQTSLSKMLEARALCECMSLSAEHKKLNESLEVEFIRFKKRLEQVKEEDKIMKAVLFESQSISQLCEQDDRLRVGLCYVLGYLHEAACFTKDGVANEVSIEKYTTEDQQLSENITNLSKLIEAIVSLQQILDLHTHELSIQKFSNLKQQLEQLPLNQQIIEQCVTINALEEKFTPLEQNSRIYQNAIAIKTEELSAERSKIIEEEERLELSYMQQFKQIHSEKEVGLDEKNKKLLALEQKHSNEINEMGVKRKSYEEKQHNTHKSVHHVHRDIIKEIKLVQKNLEPAIIAIKAAAQQNAVILIQAISPKLTYQENIIKTSSLLQTNIDVKQNIETTIKISQQESQKQLQVNMVSGQNDTNFRQVALSKMSLNETLQKSINNTEHMVRSMRESQARLHETHDDHITKGGIKTIGNEIYKERHEKHKTIEENKLHDDCAIPTHQHKNQIFLK